MSWTQDELIRLAELQILRKTHREIANELGKSRKAVERKVAALRERAATPTTPAAPAAPTDVDYWRKECRRLSKALESERWNKTVTETLADEVLRAAPLSYSPAPPVQWPARTGGSAQSAVLLFSDTHVGQVVRPDQTLGLGEYNFQVFRARLKRLEEAVHSILHDHVTTPVSELVVPVLGDMIHGALGHSVEAGQVNTLFDQFYGAGHAIAQFLRNLSALVPKVRIFSTVGNHPRWQNQHRMPTDNRYSNLDQFLYAFIQSLLRDIPTIDWRLDRQPFAVFDVQGWTFYCGHGDNLRGGDKALGIPAHAIGRNVGSTMGLRSRAGASQVNYYCFGHVHRPIQIPHTLGEVITNGGFPGVDGYGLAEGFQSYWPSQKFFLVHPKFGRAACYDLRLDTAPKSPEPHYYLPEANLV